VIEVSNWLIDHTAALILRLSGHDIPCQSGKQLGSFYAGDSEMMMVRPVRTSTGPGD